MKRTYPIRETNYEEIKKKRLNEFYVAVQIISFELPLGEKCILEKSRIYMIYGIDIIKKILYVATERNKRLEQAFKIVYNPIMKISISEEVAKIAQYTQYKWKADGERISKNIFIRNRRRILQTNG